MRRHKNRKENLRENDDGYQGMRNRQRTKRLRKEETRGNDKEMIKKGAEREKWKKQEWEIEKQGGKIQERRKRTKKK